MSLRWLPIKGFEGLYEVSDHGDVRSLDRLQPQRGGRSPRRLKGQLLKASKQPVYCRVTLYHPENPQRTPIPIYVHTLVCAHFVGPKPSSRHHVNHIDGNKYNNFHRNLEWVMPRENIRHAFSLGLAKPVNKASAETIRQIRAAPGSGRLVAAAFGVSETTVRNIRKGVTR